MPRRADREDLPASSSSTKLKPVQGQIMPRKQKDPIVEVMRYFETASLDAAKTALEVVTEIVHRRTPAPTRTKKAPTQAEDRPELRRSRAEEAIDEQQKDANPAPKPSRRKKEAALYEPDTGQPAQPLKLSTLPGVQSVVGE